MPVCVALGSACFCFVLKMSLSWQKPVGGTARAVWGPWPKSGQRLEPRVKSRGDREMHSQEDHQRVDKTAGDGVGF